MTSGYHRLSRSICPPYANRNSHGQGISPFRPPKRHRFATMRSMELSLKQARRLVLQQQGLLQSAAFGRSPAAVPKAVSRLHHVQIDTISVVDRAHHHILQARIPGYRQQWLHDAQARDRTVFEYWYHAAAYLPMADYRFYLPIMGNYSRRHLIDRKLRREILARLKAEGAVEARHFDHPDGRRSSGWWDWKPAKLTMERMFFCGELMVARREGFRKIYDLPENVLPAHVDTSPPSDSERGEFYVRRMLDALGIAPLRDLLYVRPTLKRLCGHDIQPQVSAALERLAESGEVTRCHLQGVENFCLTKALAQLPSRLGRRRIHFLSPFDNLVINRRRLKDLFGFDYQLECYVPASKRKHGYFCLPILYGDEFIGRMDCKAQRKEGVLQVYRLTLEPGIRQSPALQCAMTTALDDYARALGCNRTRF